MWVSLLLTPPPPCQALNTLEHLLEMGIPGVCNKWLTLPPNPDIVDIDLLYQVMVMMVMVVMMMMMMLQTAGSGSKRLDLSGVAEARAGAGGVVLKRTRGVAGDTASTESPSPESLLEDTVSTPTGIQNRE